MLQNLVAGLQGVIDHVLVGQLLGFTANAAIGVSWQIFLVVIVFMASLFTGQAVLVARFAGAGDSERVNRVVQQAFLTAIGDVRRAGRGRLLRVAACCSICVNAAPEVKAQALPFLRINFVCSIGMLLFFMLSAALRAAGDTRTPLRLGLTMTVLNVILNIILIRGLGSDSGARHGRLGAGDRDRLGDGQHLRALSPVPRRLRRSGSRATWTGGPTGRSSSRCSGSACRPACRASR